MPWRAFPWVGRPSPEPRARHARRFQRHSAVGVGGLRLRVFSLPSTPTTPRSHHGRPRATRPPRGAGKTTSRSENGAAGGGQVDFKLRGSDFGTGGRGCHPSPRPALEESAELAPRRYHEERAWPSNRPPLRRRHHSCEGSGRLDGSGQPCCWSRLCTVARLFQKCCSFKSTPCNPFFLKGLRPRVRYPPLCKPAGSTSDPPMGQGLTRREGCYFR